MGTKVELAPPPKKIIQEAPYAYGCRPIMTIDQHPFTQIPCLGLLVTIQDHATMLLGFLSDPALVGHPCEGRASDIYGSPWQSMVIHGYPWLSMDNHGYPWLTIICRTVGGMDGRMDARIVGWSDGRTVRRSDGRMVGRSDGRTVGW